MRDTFRHRHESDPSRSPATDLIVCLDSRFTDNAPPGPSNDAYLTAPLLAFSSPAFERALVLSVPDEFGVFLALLEELAAFAMKALVLTF